jgi:hypothetical protein
VKTIPLPFEIMLDEGVPSHLNVLSAPAELDRPRISYVVPEWL